VTIPESNGNYKADILFIDDQISNILNDGAGCKQGQPLLSWPSTP
jgi:hypothetical protein